MNFQEMICFAKVYQAALYPQYRQSVTKTEVETTIEVLKKMADERQDWSDEQKEFYKLMADFAKEYIKNREMA